MEIKMQFYKEQLYIISEFDITQSNLEEYKIQAKKLVKDSHHENGDMGFQDKLVVTNTTIYKMLAALEKWQEAQKVILSLDAVFSQ